MLEKIFATSQEERTYYEYLTLYKEYVYKSFDDEERKQHFLPSYNLIKQIQMEEGYHSLDTMPFSISEVESFLEKKQKEASKIVMKNKPYVTQLAKNIQEIFFSYVPSNIPIQDKILFISHFLEKHFTYPEQDHLYKDTISMSNQYYMDVKYGVPVDSSLEGLFAIRQGVCDEICNFVDFLCKNLSISSEKTFTTYNGYMHAISTFYVGDNFYSLCDFTRIIRKNKSMKECVLVDPNTLNQKNEYGENEIEPFRFQKFKPKKFAKVDSSYYKEFQKKYFYLLTMMDEAIYTCEKHFFDIPVQSHKTMQA